MYPPPQPTGKMVAGTCEVNIIEEKEFALTKDYTAAHHAFERRKMIEKEIKKCDVWKKHFFTRTLR